MKNLYCRHLREADGQFGHRFVFQSRGEAPAAKVPEAAAPAPTTEAKPAEPAKAVEGAEKKAEAATVAAGRVLAKVPKLSTAAEKITAAWKEIRDTTTKAEKDTKQTVNVRTTLNLRDVNGKVVRGLKPGTEVTIADEKVYTVAGKDFVKVKLDNDSKEYYVAKDFLKPSAALATAPTTAPAPPAAAPAAVAAVPSAAPVAAPAALSAAAPAAPVAAPAPAPAPPPAPAAAAPEKVQDFTSGNFFQIREASGNFKTGEIIYSPAKIAGNELPTDAVVVRSDGSQVKLTAALTALQPLTPDSNTRDKGLQKTFLADVAQSTKRPVEEIKVAAKDTATPSITRTPTTNVAKEGVAVAANTIVKNAPAAAGAKPAEAVAAVKAAPPAAVPAAPASAPAAAPTAAPSRGSS